MLLQVNTLVYADAGGGGAGRDAYSGENPGLFAAGFPSFDALANSIGIGAVALKFKELGTAISNLAIVKQIMDYNRIFTDIQKGIGATLGKVQDEIGKVRDFISTAMGTYNYWKNFKLKDVIPLFDPKAFSAFNEFNNLRDQLKGIGQSVTTPVTAGSPYAEMTMTHYINKNTLSEMIQRGQEEADERAEQAKKDGTKTKQNSIKGHLEETAEMSNRMNTSINKILDSTYLNTKLSAMQKISEAEINEHINTSQMLNNLNSKTN
jgi:hypothetical protein